MPSWTITISSVEEPAPNIDFALECTGHEAVRAFAPKVLALSLDFGVISVGALAQEGVLEQVTANAQNNNALADRSEGHWRD